eukprot:149594_1
MRIVINDATNEKEVEKPDVEELVTQWQVIQYKGKGHKTKTITFKSNTLVEVDNGKQIAKLTDISKIYVGKCTDTLKNNKSAKSKPQDSFFSLIVSKNKKRSIDFETLGAKHLKQIIFEIMSKLYTLGKSPTKGMSYVKDEIESLQRNQSNETLQIEFVEIEKQLDKTTHQLMVTMQADFVPNHTPPKPPTPPNAWIPLDPNRKSWNFKVYDGNTEAKQIVMKLKSDNTVVMDEKSYDLQDLYHISFGKCTKTLIENEQTSQMPHNAFITLYFKDGNDTVINLQEIQSRDRVDVLYKILDALFDANPSKIAEDADARIKVRNLNDTETYSFNVIQDPNWVRRPSKVPTPPAPMSPLTKDETVHVQSMGIDHAEYMIKLKQIDERHDVELTLMREEYERKLNDIIHDHDLLQRELNDIKADNEHLNGKTYDIVKLETEMERLQGENTHLLKTTKQLQRDATKMLNGRENGCDMDRLRNELDTANETCATLKLQMQLLKAENRKLKLDIERLLRKTNVLDLNPNDYQQMKRQNKMLRRELRRSRLIDAPRTMNDADKDNESKMNEDHDDKQAQMTDYIRRVKLVLSDPHWKKFRAQLSRVTMKTQAAHDNNRHQFIQNTVFALGDIFDRYPEEVRHLMDEFEVIFTDKEDRKIFAMCVRQYRQKMRFETDDVASVSEMLLHGKGKTYRVQVRLGENEIFIGNERFAYNDIYKVNIGDENMFCGNPSKHCCMAILTAKGTVLLQTKSQKERDFWINALEDKPRRYSVVSVENWSRDVGLGPDIAHDNHVKKRKEKQSKRTKTSVGCAIKEENEYTVFNDPNQYNCNKQYTTRNNIFVHGFCI